jgi:isopenicillin N synthase-like dioxygenase
VIIYTRPADAPVLPIIDFSGSFSPGVADRRAVAREVHKAARHTGFFYAAGHGIPQAVLDGQLEWTRRLFAMPDSAKQAVAISKSKCMRGYEQMGLQTLDQGSPPDLKESFMLARDLAPEHEYVRRGVPNHGPNQWPNNLPGFREQIETYQTHVEALGQHLMRCLALSLDLPESQFDDGRDQTRRASDQCASVVGGRPDRSDHGDHHAGIQRAPEWGPHCHHCGLVPERRHDVNAASGEHGQGSG